MEGQSGEALERGKATEKKKKKGEREWKNKKEEERDIGFSPSSPFLALLSAFCPKTSSQIYTRFNLNRICSQPFYVPGKHLH